MKKDENDIRGEVAISLSRSRGWARASERRGRERHLGKLVSVCGDVFKSLAAPRNSSEPRVSPRRRGPLRRGALRCYRQLSATPRLSLSLPLSFLFFPDALCLLNSFYLATIRARAYPIIDFVSFHGRCFRGEGTNEGGRRRERQAFQPGRNRPTSPGR